MLVICPHQDDAFISLGGFLVGCHSRGEKIRIVDIFSLSSFTKQGFGDMRAITRTRKEEEKRACAMVGVVPVFLDFKESVLRGYHMEDDVLTYPSEFDPSIDKDTPAEVAERLALMVKEDPKEPVLAPLAVGDHVDHVVARMAVERLIEAGSIETVVFYEDLPYASSSPVPEDIITRYALEPVLFTIDLQKKISFVEIYSSQPVHEWLDRIVSASKKYTNDDVSHERLWAGKGSGWR